MGKSNLGNNFMNVKTIKKINHNFNFTTLIHFYVSGFWFRLLFNRRTDSCVGEGSLEDSTLESVAIPNFLDN